MSTYLIKSSNNQPCYFDAKHEIIISNDDLKFDYDEVTNPQGTFQGAVVEADNDFLAGIEFIRSTFDAEALRDLIDYAIEDNDSYGEIPRELVNLIMSINRYLPLDYQRLEGEHFDAVR